MSDKREKQVDNSTTVVFRELRCRVDRDAAVLIGVQFQRLDELAAGVLLNGGKAAWFERLYPNTRVVENDVLKEYRNLIQRFGTATRIKEGETGGSFELRVSGADQPEMKIPAPNAKKPPPKSLTTFELPRLTDMPLIDEVLHIMNEPTWPSSIKLQYSGQDFDGNSKTALDNLQAWRYLSRSDLDAYSSRLSKYNSLIGDRGYRQRAVPKAIQLFQYLTANGWPEHFLHSSTTISADGCIALNFAVNSYDFAVEIALIQNLSSKPLSIARLIGSTSGGAELRSSDGPKNIGVPISAGEQALQPDEILIIPLRLSFDGGDIAESTVSADDRALEQKHVEARSRAVQDSKSGTKFKLFINTDMKNKLKRGKESNSYEIVKTRESFTPHAVPLQKSYSFGPQWSLAGLDLGGERVDFDKVVPDQVALTVGGGEGSCPILYAWRDEERRWERWGKIIHNGVSRLKQQTEAITYDGWVSRFRIAEEELERSHLDRARAIIVLADGSSRELAPDNPALLLRDGRYVELNADDEIEVNFSLPVGVAASSVRETRLIVTGYYERYSALLIERFSRKPRLKGDVSVRAGLR